MCNKATQLQEIEDNHNSLTNMPVSTVTETSSVKQFTVPVRVRVPHTEKECLNWFSHTRVEAMSVQSRVLITYTSSSNSTPQHYAPILARQSHQYSHKSTKIQSTVVDDNQSVHVLQSTTTTKKKH